MTIFNFYIIIYIESKERKKKNKMILIFGLLIFLAYYIIKNIIIGAMICYSYYEDWRDKKWFKKYKNALSDDKI